MPDPRTLLAWYDRHRRELPWRVTPDMRAKGVVADPYRVWLSEVMLQQTTVATVKSYFETFTRLWPTVVDLAAADTDDVMKAWAGLGYYARARNLKKCAEAVVAEYGGRFPTTAEALRALPGIGDRDGWQCRACHFAHLCHRNAAAGGKTPDEGKARDVDPCGSARRFRPGYDGSRRHDMHAAPSGLRALSLA
jgi:HhH-GPD superfamily base excision DNA repair protein